MYFDHLFQHFISQDQLRPFFCVPNAQDGYVYATDGHQAIRIPTNLLENEYKNQSPITFAKVWPTRDRMRFSPLEIQPHELQSLLQNIPTRIVDEVRDCDDCGGEGNIHCDHCHHSHDCEECDGNGYVPTGKKIEKADDRYKICFERKTHVAPHLLLNLLRCAEATQEPIYLVTVCDGKKMLFTTGQIEVLIMNYTKHYIDEFSLHFPLPTAASSPAEASA